MSGSLSANRKAEFKASIRLLKKKPMNCAVGDVEKIAEIRLHHTRGATSLLADLRREEPKVVKPACGLAFVPSEKPTELHMDLNSRPASNICRRLALRLRGTGLRKVILLVAGKEVESHEMSEEEAGPLELESDAEPAAPAPALDPLTGRIDAASAMIGRFPANDRRGPAARAALADIAALIRKGDASALGKLAQLEGLLAAGLPAGPATDTVAKQALQGAIQNAYPDIHAARFQPEANVAELNGLIADMTAAKEDGNFDAAIRLALGAQSVAVRMNGQARRTEQQRTAYAQFEKLPTILRKSYFDPIKLTAAAELAHKEPEKGATYKALVAAQNAVKDNPTIETCDALAAAAERYTEHYYTELNVFQRNTTDHRLKKRNAVAAATAARHMKLALQLQSFGPPPWTAEMEEEVAALRATLAFETNHLVDPKTKKPVPVQAKALGDDGGCTAAFWVDGRDANGQDGNDHVFLFKPVEGEIGLTGFQACGGAPREVITQAAADALFATTGLDLGCPEAHLVSVAESSIDAASYNANKKKDAVWLSTKSQEYKGSLQQFKASNGPLQKNDGKFDWTAFAPAEAHKVALLDILTLNLDRHSGNLLLTRETQGDGPVKLGLVPIDHGLTLPSLDSLEMRAPDRMNNTQGNCLLKMPASFEKLSADMVQRLDLLDPNQFAGSIRQTRDMLASQHADLAVRTTVPDANIEIARRSAMFLKMAARSLSPAVVQILIAANHKALLDPEQDERAFLKTAERLIAEYAPRGEALRTLYCGLGVSLEDICARLKTLGYVTFDSAWPTQLEKFRLWLAENAVEALKAYQDNVPKPTAATSSNENTKADERKVA